MYIGWGQGQVQEDIWACAVSYWTKWRLSALGGPPGDYAGALTDPSLSTHPSLVTDPSLPTDGCSST